MIDWLTFRASTQPHDVFHAGAVMKIDAESNTEWLCPSRLSLIGSYDASITIKSIDSTIIEISGNPTKFFQGHNLWGSNYVPGLAAAMCAHIEKVTPLVITDIRRFSRVDIAGLVDMGTPDEVRDYLRYLGTASTARHRGKGEMTHEGTVYFGKKSRRWALKLYDKGREVVSTRSVRNMDVVAAIASGKMRVEVVLRGLELASRDLRHVEQWCTLDPMKLLAEFLEGLELPEQPGRLDVQALPRHLRLPFYQWAQGDDLRTLYSKPTFYRYRKQFLDLVKLDISVPPSAPMTHIDELSAGYASFEHMPDFRTFGFWEPSEVELQRLPTFNAGPAA